jgi:hypothetical protein
MRPAELEQLFDAAATAPQYQLVCPSLCKALRNIIVHREFAGCELLMAAESEPLGSQLHLGPRCQCVWRVWASRC